MKNAVLLGKKMLVIALFVLGCSTSVQCMMNQGAEVNPFERAQVVLVQLQTSDLTRFDQDIKTSAGALINALQEALGKGVIEDALIEKAETFLDVLGAVED